MDGRTEHLIKLLRQAQNQIATAPIHVVGTKITAVANPGGGNVTGMKITVHSGAAGSGPTIGMVSVASSSQGAAISAERGRLSAEIGEAIEDLQGGRARKSMLMRIVERFGGAALGVGADVLKDQIEQAIGGLPG